MNGLERYWFHRRRTPAWADKKAVNALYRQSKRLGPSYHVDHIVPLVSNRVCGLHCEANLEIVQKLVNLKKSNYYWPDMWNEQQDLRLVNCMVHQCELPL